MTYLYALFGRLTLVLHRLGCFSEGKCDICGH